MDINELYNTETREGIYVDDANRPYDGDLDKGLSSRGET